VEERAMQKNLKGTHFSKNWTGLLWGRREYQHGTILYEVNDILMQQDA
jgi:hypothetical protein